MSRLLVRRGAQVRALEFTGTPLVSEVLQGANLAPAQPCGGRGTCGKCAVRLSGAVSAPNAAEERAGQRLSCQARLLGDAEVELPEARAQEIEVAGIARPLHLAPLAGRYGAAVDIGTTTLALRLYDLHSGAALGQASCWNPQGTVAADVMGRIGAALDGKARSCRRRCSGRDRRAAAHGVQRGLPAGGGRNPRARRQHDDALPLERARPGLALGGALCGGLPLWADGRGAGAQRGAAALHERLRGRGHHLRGAGQRPCGVRPGGRALRHRHKRRNRPLEGRGAAGDLHRRRSGL